MQERHFNRKAYFDEQRATCKEFYLPYIQQAITLDADTRILEIGCGEGGNLAPFAEMGCQTTGIELLSWRVEQARAFFQSENLQGTFIAANIFDIDRHDMTFDVVILHDVIEHIVEKDRLLKQLHRFLKPDGVVFIAFPAWQMPFGGHQQICRSSLLSHFPFIHLLPTSLYRLVLRASGESNDCINELLSIKQTHIQ